MANNDSLYRTKRALRVLVVSQHYWPEPFAYSDICEGLVAAGHYVTVLTGTPNYPEGAIYPGYEDGARSMQVRNGVKIVRAQIRPRGQSVSQRVANYYSFASSAAKIARSMDSGFDVVLSIQTSPVLMSRPALAYGKKHGAPVLLWCQDLWPESLTVGGIKKGSAVYEHFRRVSKRIYSSASMLAVSSRAYDDYFRDVLEMDGAAPLYLPQCAEDVFAEGAPRREEYDTRKVNITFAGNLGVAQDVHTLVEAGGVLGGDGRFVLHVVGSGSELQALKQHAEDIGAECVAFHGRHAVAQMPSFYASSDAMVATFQDNPILPYVLPRKIITYMAAGRPILATAAGEVRRVVEEAGCGLCCEPGDPTALAGLFRRFADMPSDEREEMGARGRLYYEQHFAKDRFFSTLEDALQKLKGAGHGC